MINGEARNIDVVSSRTLQMIKWRPDTKLELHKKEPTKLELQKNEPSKLEDK